MEPSLWKLSFHETITLQQVKAQPVVIPDKRDSQSLEGNRPPVAVLGAVHFSEASLTNLLKFLQL